MSDVDHIADLNANSIFKTESTDTVIADDTLPLSALVEKARNIANQCMDQTILTKQNTHVSLGRFLHALLDYASHDELQDGSTGIRYTATVICTSHDEGRLQDAALIWIEHLFIPIRAAAEASLDYSSEQSPDSPGEPEMMQTIEPPVKQFRNQLLKREGYRCAVHRNEVDRSHRSLTVKNKDDLSLFSLKGSHIIPYSLNGLCESNNEELKDAAVTWTLFKHWASYDIQLLVEQGINNPNNGILLCPNAYGIFRSFLLYFVPVLEEQDTYNVHMIDRDTPYTQYTFKACDGIPVPSPKLLAVHAALARVLDKSGVGDYIDTIWRERNALELLANNGSSDPRVLSYFLQTLLGIQ